MDKFSFAIIDKTSNILFKSQNFENEFKSKNNFYENILLSPYKQSLLNEDTLVLKQGISSQKLLVNIFNNNIILKKLPYVIYNKIVGISIICEPFQLNPLNMVPQDFSLSSEVLNEHKLITGYSEFQQQIIFCLLTGIRSDKLIAMYLNKKANLNISYEAIKQSILLIYKKLCLSDRDTLLYALKYLHFDNYVPKSLYPSGIYDSL